MTDPPRPLENAPAADPESETTSQPRRRATRARRTTQDRPPPQARPAPRPAEPALREAPLPEPRAPRPVEPGAPVPERHAVRFEEHLIDPDVHKVVRRLVRHGYEAYLVGGCVRDLMLGRVPKDFDVATSARPEEVRELFRNSRVIGRRFRLVHVLFGGGKVIEVATFRRNPKDETDDEVDSEGGEARPARPDLLIRTDNVFGKTHEDALRRDFTINALFYDVESHEILDYAHGMRDLNLRVVNTIGEPEVRFSEDPVRILRALKFAGRLDLGLAPDVYDAIVLCRDSLALAARPRVSEEILRLLRGQSARRTIFIAFEIGVLDVLLPEIASILYDDDTDTGPRNRLFRVLEFVDRETKQRGPLDDAVLWTLLLLEPLKEAADGARDKGLAVRDCLEPIIERLAIPRRHADAVRRLVGILPRLAAGKAGRFMHTDLYDLAVLVASADAYARGLPSPRIPARTAAEGAEADRKLPRARRRPQARR